MRPLLDYKIQEPTFSPDGSPNCFREENNLYIYNLATQKLQQITTDGKKNRIINGITDWVYEEEFAFVRAFDWNKAGNKLAYIKFDESEVPEFGMTVYNKDLYPKNETFKYPKAERKTQLFLYGCMI